MAFSSFHNRSFSCENRPFRGIFAKGFMLRIFVGKNSLQVRA